MTLLRGFDDSSPYRGGYVSIGNFDGVHRGHQRLVEQLVQRAHAAGVPGVVLTFDPHPIELLRPQHTPPSLSTLERKAELLHRHGADVIIAYPTDLALLQLTPREFFEQIIQGQLQARGLVEGPNFFFGHNRAGTIETLREYCDETGLSLDVVQPLELTDGPATLVSSSVVRHLVQQGDLTAAVKLLGHPYQLQGVVARGAERGRLLGFPTANLEQVNTLIPADGVYAAQALLGDQPIPAAVHIGPNPTFAEQQRKIEAHLLDFTGNLYGQVLQLNFLHRIRGTRKFADADELKHQLQQDIQTVRGLVD